jgi:hypothetical protein
MNPKTKKIVLKKLSYHQQELTQLGWQVQQQQPFYQYPQAQRLLHELHYNLNQLFELIHHS